MPPNNQTKSSEPSGVRTLPYQKSTRPIETNFNLLTLLENMWDGQLHLKMVVQHRIQLEETDGQTIYSAPYCTGPKVREIKKQEINRMLVMDFIEPKSIERAPFIVFVPEKDGTLCISADYCKLNAETVWDWYPNPRMDECIDFLKDEMAFSTLDDSGRNWLVEVA